MRFTWTTKQQPDALPEAFYCRSRRRTLTLTRCLEDYVTANAFMKSRSACYRCPLGQTNRRTYAEQAEAEADAA